MSVSFNGTLAFIHTGKGAEEEEGRPEGEASEGEGEGCLRETQGLPVQWLSDFSLQWSPELLQTVL